MAEPPRIPRAVLIVVAAAAALAIGLLVVREAARGPGDPSDPAYRYSLGGIGAAPPELPRLSLLREIPVGLDDPRGVAAGPDGTLAVCGDRTLLLLDSEGSLAARYPLEAEPSCVAFGEDGRLYVGLQDHVEVIDPRDGSRRLWPDLGGQAIITSIAVRGTEVYVADAGNRMVLRFDARGKLLGHLDDQFLVPSPYFDVAAAPDGTLWVVDPGRHRLRQYTPEGKLLTSWGRASLDIDGFGGCCNPTHIALLPDGSFVTSERGIPRVKLYAPDGGLAALVAAPRDFGEYEAGLDLAVSSEGTIVLLVPGARSLRLYRPGDGASP